MYPGHFLVVMVRTQALKKLKYALLYALKKCKIIANTRLISYVLYKISKYVKKNNICTLI